MQKDIEWAGERYGKAIKKRERLKRQLKDKRKKRERHYKDVRVS